MGVHCNWTNRIVRLGVALALHIAVLLGYRAQAADLIEIKALEGTNIWVSPAGAVDWVPASVQLSVLKAGDRVRTGERTRVALRLRGKGVLRIPENSEFEIRPPAPDRPSLWLGLRRGLLYFFHRGEPGDIEVHSRAAVAAIRGTEFVTEVDEEGRMIVTVLDGEVELRNDQGVIRLISNERGRAEPDKPPTKTAVLNAISVIQWCLYYPGILDLEELNLLEQAQTDLAASLLAYRQGDLLQALVNYPAGRQPSSPEERLFLAGLFLAVGKVSEAEELLGDARKDDKPGDAQKLRRLANALSQLMATVKGQHASGAEQGGPVGRTEKFATEWLAASYAFQAQFQLEEALAAAQRAVGQSPQFGFAWARIGELEFTFGRAAKGARAVQKALELSPRNAQAIALKGFLLAAQNKIKAAEQEFARAVRWDGGLANAWLGLGLCRIRQGDIPRGLGDLEMAAATEPQRALLRSYLGKGYAKAGQAERAKAELTLAKELDANDPTSWLYSALLNQQGNRINEAIRDVEKSHELNDNRALFRSRLLLDQDRAVRSINMAGLYRDAGMQDWSLREAMHAVNMDYANYSAHLFLANSYAELSDPGLVNLRYETARVNEYLLATLLAPVSAGILSQPVSQHEYSRLFEENRLGLFSSTEYRSGGDWVQSAAQYGTLNNISYSLEPYYRSHNGQRPNNDLLQKALGFQTKVQFTGQDSIYLQTFVAETEGGDLRQVFHPKTDVSKTFRFEEHLDPILLAGYHREWAPGVHTLLLGGMLDGQINIADPAASRPYVDLEGDLSIDEIFALQARQRYQSDSRIFHFEIGQIVQKQKHTLSIGARYQTGDFKTKSALLDPVLLANRAIPLTNQISNPLQVERADLERLSFYAYENWQMFEPLTVTAGVTYDHLTYPSNYRFPPISEGEASRDAVSPKFGAFWKPVESTALRAAYTRSLGGVSFDQSFRLEPTQVAGFNHAWRSMIPESITGANSAEEFENWGLALDQKFPTGTYLGITAEWLDSHATRTIGAFRAFVLPNITRNTFQSGLEERLDFVEKSLAFTLNQLFGDEWSIGLNYRISEAQIEGHFAEIPPMIETPESFPRHSQSSEALLHHIYFATLYNHPSGFFAKFENHWYGQHFDTETDLGSGQGADSDFWQLHLFAGYRLLQRRAEFTLGLLNLTDRNYRLHPANVFAELPQGRTLVARVTFNY